MKINKFALVLSLLAVSLSPRALAQPASSKPVVVENGTYALALLPGIQFQSDSIIMSGNYDPSSIATSGTVGSLFLSSLDAQTYQKQDSGTTTNWIVLGSGGGGGPPTGPAGGDLTGSYPNPTLAAVGTAGTYTKITFDAKGRETSGTTLSAGDIPSLLASKISDFSTAVSASIGFTPEDVANKATDLTSPDNVKYPSTLAVSTAISGISFPVTSVFTRTGAVTAQSGDYDTLKVTENTNLYFTNARAIGAPITGYVSGAGTVAATDTVLQAINKLNGNDALKAPLASPALTGNPTAPTQAASDASTKLATTAYADNSSGTAALAVVVQTINSGDTAHASSSDALFTALSGKEPTISATTSADYYRGDKTFQNFTSAAQASVVTQVITNGVTATSPSEDAVFDALALKAPIASPALTGNPTAPTQTAADNSTKISTTAYADNSAASAAAASIVQTIVNGDTTHASSSDALFDALALKLDTSLADTKILVGNGSNIATPVFASGDLTLADTGAFTIANLAVTNAKIANSTIDLTTKVTGILPVANGGTNSSTALSGSSIMISNGSAVTQGAAGTSTTLLHGNAAGAPTYSAASLTADVSGVLPVANGGTNKSSWTAGSIAFAGAGGTALTENTGFPFSWDNTNSRLNVGATGTGKINVTAAGGTDLALNVFSTAANNAVQIQNQSGYSVSLLNAAASATAGASIGGMFSRGTLAARTQSLAGDQLFSLSSQGYTGSAFGPGLSGAISFVATENTTATANGNLIAFSTTPNTTLVPVTRMTIGQNGVVNIANLTASLPVQTDASKNLVSAAITLSGSQVTGTLGAGNGGTGITSLAAGIATFLGTSSSANLAAAVTDESGSGALVFATSPTLVTPALGTPSSATLTNATGLPISTGVSGLGSGVATFLGTASSANLAAALTDETGTGVSVFSASPALTGVPTAPTATGGTNTTQIATTAFVQAALPSTKTYTTISGTTTGSSAVAGYFGDTSGGAFTFTYPAAASNANVQICIKNVTFGGSNNITLARSGSDTIEGGTSATVMPGDGYCFASDGVSAWFAFQ